MTDVLVCVKRVPDFSGEVLLTEDAQSADARFVGYTMSNHDQCAVELGVQVAAATDGQVTVLTIGTADSVEQLRSALGVGATAAVLVEADPVALGPADVAHEIAQVVSERDYGLVLLGNDAADSGDFQVGIRLAYELGRPVVNGASTVTVEDEHVVAVGEGPGGQETYRVPLPAVVTIREGGVEPRYPSVPGRLKAKKIPIEERQPVSEPVGGGRVKMTLPPPTPSAVQILGEGAGAAPAVVDVLEKLGVLSK